MGKGAKVGERIGRVEVINDVVCWGKEFGFYFIGGDI